MQTAAVLWHVSLLAEPSHKAIALGIVGLVRVLPIIGFSLLSGVVADAVDRRKLMTLTQSLMAILACWLAWITFRGLDNLWPVYVITALSAAAAAFDAPARQALIPSLVPREHLPNALSLNAVMFQVASVAGPSLAGVMIATLGVAWVYAANAVSFLFVIVALLMMRGLNVDGVRNRGSVSLRAAGEGLRFVFSSPTIRSTMMLDFFATFFSSATALLPIFAQDILKVGAHGYGWLYAAPSVGAVLASLGMIRWIEQIDRRGLVLLWAVAVYGIATIFFGVSTSFWLTFACLAITGAADTVSMVIRNIIRQLETPDQLRGRMVGVNMVFFMGGPQLGELEAGLVANWAGAVLSVVSGGLGCLVATAWIGWVTPDLISYRRSAVASEKEG